jgi:hypothetical protein
MGKLEGRRMTHAAHRWGTIETHFSTFAAWVDREGRLVIRGGRAIDARGARTYA